MTVPIRDLYGARCTFCNGAVVQLNLYEAGSARKLVRLCASHAYSSARPAGMREISQDELERLQLTEDEGIRDSFEAAKIKGYLTLNNSLATDRMMDHWRKTCNETNAPIVFVRFEYGRQAKVSWHPYRIYTPKAGPVTAKGSKGGAMPVDLEDELRRRQLQKHVDELYTKFRDNLQTKHSWSIVHSAQHTTMMESAILKPGEAHYLAQQVVELERILRDENLLIASLIHET